jgi:outer membrane protein assembly factor BamB
MKRAILPPLALLLVLAAAVFAAQGVFKEPRIAWRYMAPDSLAGAVVAHLKPGREKQIVQIANNGPLIALDCRGKVIWQVDLGRLHNGIPSAFDINDDGNDEIIFEDGLLGVYALNGDGKEIWRNPDILGAGQFNAAAAIGDVDGDSSIEVVLTAGSGTVASLDAATGKTEWVFRFEKDDFTGHPALSDIDADGIIEVVVFGYEWGIFVLDGRDGRLKSKLPTMEKWKEGGYSSGPAVCDLDGDGLKEMVFEGYWKGLAFALKPDMSTYWLYDAYNEIGEIFIYESPSIGDINGDGVVEVICVGKNGEFTIFSPDGRKLWSMRLGERSIWSPPLVDVDDDAAKDILITGSKKFFIVDGRERKPVWGFGRKSGGYPGSEYPAQWPTALVEDLDGDGKIDIYVIDYEAGISTLIKLKARLRDKWPCYMQNNMDTGYDEPVPDSCFLKCSTGLLHSGPLRISFGLKKRIKMSLRITDLSGRELYAYPRGRWEAGVHHLILGQESVAGSGTVFCKLVTDESTIARKALLAR